MNFEIARSDESECQYRVCGMARSGYDEYKCNYNYEMNNKKKGRKRQKVTAYFFKVALEEVRF